MRETFVKRNQTGKKADICPPALKAEVRIIRRFKFFSVEYEVFLNYCRIGKPFD